MWDVVMDIFRTSIAVERERREFESHTPLEQIKLIDALVASGARPWECWFNVLLANQEPMSEGCSTRAPKHSHMTSRPSPQSGRRAGSLFVTGNASTAHAEDLAGRTNDPGQHPRDAEEHREEQGEREGHSTASTTPLIRHPNHVPVRVQPRVAPAPVVDRVLNPVVGVLQHTPADDLAVVVRRS